MEQIITEQDIHQNFNIRHRKNKNIPNQFTESVKIQGFLQNEQPPMISKFKQSIQKIKGEQQVKYFQSQFKIDQFYKIPQAKPLLSKQFIDESKPKVLIKQIPIYREPDQLTAYKITNIKQNEQSLVNQKNDKRKKVKTVQNKQATENTPLLEKEIANKNQQITLWQKYLVKSGYQCIYLKYLRGSLQEYYPKQLINDSKAMKQERKRLRNQLLRMCHNNQNLFNTYFIDLQFISEAGSSLIRNLIDCNIDQIYQIYQKQQQETLQKNNQKNKVKFDSKFQSGNLFAVFQKINKKTYQPIEQRTFDLILQNDINTKGYTNWFYFSIFSKNKGNLKFNIVNMQKSYSFFNNGMKVFVFSYQKYKNQQIQWHRDGFNYSYMKNEISKSKENSMKYNTLSFCLDQKYDNDLIYISAAIPYTYSRLIKYLDGVQKVAKLNSNIYLKKQNIASSISSNLLPVLTLTWKRDKKQKKQNQNKKKKIIGIIARQHPGQTMSSFVMQGIINSLIYSSQQSSVYLLKNYIFKIIPMVNIDGVIYGNSRCDISGSDINRKWTRNPNKILFPIISQIRKLFKNILAQDYSIDYFLDLHGHSRKLGSFIYSCKTADEIQSRCYSWLLSKICNKFVFQSSTFGLPWNKKETARGLMSDFVTCKRSLTVETSFYGYKKFNNICSFQIKDFHEIAENLLQAIYSNQTRNPKVFNWTNIKNQISNYLQKQKLSKNQLEEEEQSGSNSNPSQDQMNNEQKASSFLPPSTAVKIGLTQIKVIQRKKRKKQQEIDLNTDQNLKLGKNDLEKNKIEQDTLSRYFSKNLNQLASENKFFRLRQTRSVTKISPFKFTERIKKSLSTKKIRLAIEVKYIQKNQKMSTPSLLPQLQQKQSKIKNKKKDFWEIFNKQYETIIKEKNILLNQTDSKQVKASLKQFTALKQISTRKLI